MHKYAQTHTQILRLMHINIYMYMYICKYIRMFLNICIPRSSCHRPRSCDFLAQKLAFLRRALGGDEQPARTQGRAEECDHHLPADAPGYHKYCYMCVYICTHTQTHTYSRTHTRTHTHTHAHTRTHTHT